MPFTQDGYFSAEASAWTQRNCGNHAALFKLAEKFNRHCHEIVAGLIIHQDEGQQILGAALYVRVLGFYQAALLVTERGMSNEAKVLLRSLLEATFTIRAIASSPEVMREYIAADQRQRLSVFRRVQNNPSGFKAVLADGREGEIEALIAEVEADVQTNKPKKLHVSYLAEKAGLKDTYDTAYVLFSGTVHSAVRDLEQYLQLNAEGSISEMKWGPDGSDIDRLLITTIECASHSLRAVEALFNLDPVLHDALLKEFGHLARGTTEQQE